MTTSVPPRSTICSTSIPVNGSFEPVDPVPVVPVESDEPVPSVVPTPLGAVAVVVVTSVLVVVEVVSSGQCQGLVREQPWVEMDVRCEPFTQTVSVAPEVLCRDCLFGQTTKKRRPGRGCCRLRVRAFPGKSAK